MKLSNILFNFRTFNKLLVEKGMPQISGKLGDREKIEAIVLALLDNPSLFDGFTGYLTMEIRAIKSYLYTISRDSDDFVKFVDEVLLKNIEELNTRITADFSKGHSLETVSKKYGITAEYARDLSGNSADTYANKLWDLANTLNNADQHLDDLAGFDNVEPQETVIDEAINLRYILKPWEDLDNNDVLVEISIGYGEQIRSVGYVVFENNNPEPRVDLFDGNLDYEFFKALGNVMVAGPNTIKERIIAEANMIANNISDADKYDNSSDPNYEFFNEFVNAGGDIVKSLQLLYDKFGYEIPGEDFLMFSEASEKLYELSTSGYLDGDSDEDNYLFTEVGKSLILTEEDGLSDDEHLEENLDFVAYWEDDHLVVGVKATYPVDINFEDVSDNSDGSLWVRYMNFKPGEEGNYPEYNGLIISYQDGTWYVSTGDDIFDQYVDDESYESEESDIGELYPGDTEEKLTADLKIFLKPIFEILGAGFHPDDRFEDYIDGETRLPVFSEEVAAEYEKQLITFFERADAVDVDIYEICLNMLNSEFLVKDSDLEDEEVDYIEDEDNQELEEFSIYTVADVDFTVTIHDGLTFEIQFEESLDDILEGAIAGDGLSENRDGVFEIEPDFSNYETPLDGFDTKGWWDNNWEEITECVSKEYFKS